MDYSHHKRSDRSESLAERWEAVALPASEVTEKCFSSFLKGPNGLRRVLNCAIPLNQALELTRFSLPEGVTVSDCLVASVTGIFPPALRDWTYKPKIRAVPQLPWLHPLPPEHAMLWKIPWFQFRSPAGWLGVNARHLRYQHELWQDIRPKVLQGVQTTLVLAMPQVGFSLTPHIQTENSFLFLGSLARGLSAVQLFPTRYLYPDAKLGSLADMPAPIFSDVLPTTGGFSYPVVECEPDPWRVLARFHRTDRYYGYPFSQVADSAHDFILNNLEGGAMLLPSGRRVTARHSQSHAYATLDPELSKELKLSADEFAAAFCLLRGTVTHDGLPFNLPVQMQTMVYAVILTHWKMELDRPGDLNSYTVATQHAAIRGFNYYQRVEPFYSNFMRVLQRLVKDPDFKSYPLSTHLTDAWLRGNVCISNRLSQSEQELGPSLMRAYYHQQLDFQMGISNLMNHVEFRARTSPSGRISRTGAEIEGELSFDGLAFHQMNRLLRFDSHLFHRPSRPPSRWPEFHSGFDELDQHLRTGCLPKI